MKTRIFTQFIVAVIAACILCAPLAGQEDFTKKVEKAFNVDENTIFSIDNKYGDIDIRDWDKSSLTVEATIVLKDMNRQKSDNLFEQINIEFTETENEIKVVTVFDEMFFKQMGRSDNNGENKFEVNYVIMLPAYLKVNVSNKYGSIFVNKLTSPSLIQLKYGTLKINQLIAENKENMAEIDLAYSKGSIETCQWMKISSKYSKLEIQKSRALLVISKYSKLNIDDGSSLICESKYDSYQIGKLSNFVTEAQYSNFKVESVSKKIDLETRYTEVKIQSVSEDFESVGVENSYGSIFLGISPSASYKLTGHARYAKISYPDNSRVNRSQDNNELNLDGIVGSGSSPAATVQIETNYGGISLY
jgi:hypothetical protein